MPKPQTDIEMFVHECDYLASRKPLIVKFEKPYNPNDYVLTATALVEEIIALCKFKIANGYDRQKLIRLIADNNNGSGDPRKIHTLAEAKKILKIIKEAE